jgi:hypothetical protein
MTRSNKLGIGKIAVDVGLRGGVGSDARNGFLLMATSSFCSNHTGFHDLHAVPKTPAPSWHLRLVDKIRRQRQAETKCRDETGKTV